MGRPGAAARRRRLASIGVATPRTIARELRIARREVEASSYLRLPGGHATLILTMTDLAILERLIADRLLRLRMVPERGREAEFARGKTRMLGTRISRLVANAAGDGACVPDPLNVSIHDLLILDDLVDPLSSVQDDAACEELLEKIEKLILSAAM